MTNAVSDFLLNLDFYSIIEAFLDNGYYEFLFPFLLSFAVFFTILSKVKIFKSKSTGKPYSSIISVVSLVVSWYGVSFETSDGYNVGNLIMMMFPNISALTIGVLSLYIVGAILGKDFFKGLFRKDHTGYMFIVIGAIGLGAVIFYVGIAMGFWDYDYLDAASYWNVILAVAFLIMGVVFILIDMASLGVLLLFVFGVFVYNYGEGNILEYFIDPVVFIVRIVIVLSDRDITRKNIQYMYVSSLTER